TVSGRPFMKGTHPMIPWSWLKCLSRSGSPRRRSRPPPRLRPSLERLESRDVPAVFHGTTLTDGIGHGSPGDAIVQSNATPGHNDIQFAVTGPHALSAQYGELLITNSDLTIDAQAQEEIIDGGRQHFRVLHIRGGNDTTTTLIGLTITNGQAEDDIPDGGGIDMVSRGTLTLIGVTVSDCSAHGSAGIYACAGNASLFR